MDRVRSDPPPVDRRFDRRSFLARMSAFLTAAAGGSLGAVWRAPPAGATPVRPIRLPTFPVQETDPAFMTVVEAATLLREGSMGAGELMEACLARVRSYESIYQAFNTVTRETALEQAHAIEDWATRDETSPLTGIPLAVKDNFFTAGVLTTANSHLFKEFVPDFDAEAWARLRAAGGILLGKTQMGPLATSRATTPDGTVTTRNAWAPGNPRISPGGSSSGSATAVAAGMALAATGTQTGGSITNPAAAQGLTGLKPTMGRVSLRGVIPLSYTRDHPGPLARDAQDVALLLQLMAGPDPADPRTLGQPSLPDLLTAAIPSLTTGGSPRLRWPTRIGVPPDYLQERGGEPPPEPPPDATAEDRARYERMREARDRAGGEVQARRRMLETFRELGADIVEVPHPTDWEVLTGGSFNNARLPERSEMFLEHLRSDVRGFGVSLSPWINGLLLSGTEYLRGQRAKLLLLERVLGEIFSRCDVVVQTRPIPFDIIGLPLISFPIGVRESEDGALPVGGLLGGMPWAEDRLISMAAAFQAATDWHRRRPPEPEVAGDGIGPAAPRDGAADGEPVLRMDVLDVWDECQ